MSTPDVGELTLDNDWEPEVDVSRKATANGSKEAAAGLTGLTAHLSETEGGDAIAGTSVALTERSGKPGRFYGVLAKATLNTAVGSYVGHYLWVVVTGTPLESSRQVLVVPTGSM